ncbi:MAG: hypothetical protein HQK53_18290 [Oligoflexia bacterium]|nr:hypothetical protein [Oligoflexia bacterium]
MKISYLLFYVIFSELIFTKFISLNLVMAQEYDATIPITITEGSIEVSQKDSDTFFEKTIVNIKKNQATFVVSKKILIKKTEKGVDNQRCVSSDPNPQTLTAAIPFKKEITDQGEINNFKIDVPLLVMANKTGNRIQIKFKIPAPAATTFNRNEKILYQKPPLACISKSNEIIRDYKIPWQFPEDNFDLKIYTNQNYNSDEISNLPISGNKIIGDKNINWTIRISL